MLRESLLAGLSFFRGESEASLKLSQPIKRSLSTAPRLNRDAATPAQASATSWLGKIKLRLRSPMRAERTSSSQEEGRGSLKR
jgi:hypothetical protein